MAANALFEELSSEKKGGEDQAQGESGVEVDPEKRKGKSPPKKVGVLFGAFED
jgi:hypothetical protein